MMGHLKNIWVDIEDQVRFVFFSTSVKVRTDWQPQIQWNDVGCFMTQELTVKRARWTGATPAVE